MFELIRLKLTQIIFVNVVNLKQQLQKSTRINCL
jgi:hypothetical protein